MKNLFEFNKRFFYVFFLIYIFLFFSFVITKSYEIALCQSIIVILAGIFNYIRSSLSKKYMHKSLNKLVDSLSFNKQNMINNLKLPIIMINNNGEIIWYNSVFRNNVLDNTDLFGQNISVIIKDFDKLFINNNPKIITNYKNKIYDVYISLSKNKTDSDESVYIMFFIDETNRSNLETQIINNKPTVVMINIDNYEDIVSNTTTSERNKIINDVELIINDYFGAGTNGIIRKTEKDLFVIVLEQKYIIKMIENKFSILEKVRTVSDNIKASVTLSIGIGLDTSNINESEQFAKQSLDMALGRGGDQVVIKHDDNFEFFGGLSSGQVKSIKVKARIVASSLMELIEESDNVVIMGHRFADLDCFGASIGMAKGVKLVDPQKEVYIVIDKEKNLVESLLEKVKNSYLENIFVSPDEVGDYINKKTLLIIVDTHIKSFLESIEVYQSCKRVVVIDHHRKVVDYINDAVIFYHEPSASSACEMVTELLQYFSNKESISNIEAEALLSGIMLDTRNFVFKTGVRTFEAAAYLKKHGANTIEVKKLFSSNMDVYQKKTKLVSTAEIYRKCAISLAKDFNGDLRVVAAQAADELLTINDIDASFVVFKFEDKTMISARSMGSINVQIIMEYLGGGGHLTMAGAQFNNKNIEESNKELLGAIDKYYQKDN
ncbi:MAG: DHH family phosphoesterase [Oscillospiraceae bacterium]|nr:DHH family phosphoesterase [Oscillospiraceae bacterium]